MDKQDFYYRAPVYEAEFDEEGFQLGDPVLIQDGMNTGYYFQGLWTHSTDVEQTDALDGDEIPDQLNQTPTDQTHDWTDLIQNAFDALPFPARLKIDCYEGPLGHGWVAVLHVKYQGNIYVRSKQVGPEEWRTHDWKLYEPEATP